MKKGKDFWGPPFWTCIHILTAAFQTGNSKYMVEFFWLLTWLLPCDYCRRNLVTKLKTYPPENYLSSRDDIFFYGYMVHDLANQHINKIKGNSDHVSPPFDEVKNHYYISLRTKGSLFWGPVVWMVIHILGATIRSDNARYFARFLNVLAFLLPDETSRRNLLQFLSSQPIEPYLRNNHDAFFYSYMLHDFINKKLGKKSPPLEKIKHYYFSSLGEECKDCAV